MECSSQSPLRVLIETESHLACGHFNESAIDIKYSVPEVVRDQQSRYYPLLLVHESIADIVITRQAGN